MENDRTVDILRVIAIISIMITHSNPNTSINQIVAYDITLMVLLIGVSFYLYYQEKRIHYMYYIKNQFNKIVIPTWIFLTIFFILFYIISLIMNDSYYFNNLDWIHFIFVYLMVGNIEYIWIVKVFFLVSIFSPLLFSLSNKIKSNKLYLLILLIGFLLYYFLLQYNYDFSNGNYQLLFQHFVMHPFGFSLIVALGIRLKKLKTREIILVCVFCFIVYFLLLVWNRFSSTQYDRYLPTLYYFSYGLFSSLLLYLFVQIKGVQKLWRNKFVIFVSENVIWLFLWHLIPIYILKFTDLGTSIGEEHFLTRLLFIFGTAILLTFIQTRFSIGRKSSRAM
ncbi:acyltransferase family protein [Evansella tamaricis]|uniref:Acyltransferase family protein n=1 Tax=Evansella tamaricis TaxID=2069301 RepID=A0ABS6JCD6_9BACI|nr:acyltransferase family protein [Evansella tamaricis]MBU9711168.1 acyltransferase family protein [Evansella tamaricis]